MNLKSLQDLVKLENDSKEFPSIHEAVIEYIFSLMLAPAPAPIQYTSFDSFYSPNHSRHYIIPSSAVVEKGRAVGKIQAIKLYKSQTGYSLIDSKHAVEDWFSINGLELKPWNQQ